ncbi:MAG: diguanylate cyclase [Actinomycetota bacterium]|nr:diguanylate cyclase [Actinomycetota bacterium]
MVALVGVFAVGFVIRGSEREQVLWLDVGCYVAVYALGGVLMIANRARAGGEIWAWRLLGLGTLSVALGDVYFSLVLAPLDDPPIPSPADFLYLLWFPLVYLSLMQFLRSKGPRLHTALWMDGLVAGCGTASIVSAFVLDDLISLTEGSVVQTSINLAYPVGDLLLILVLVASSTVLGRRPDRIMGLLGLGLFLYVLADSLYLMQDAEGRYQEGGLLDLCWLLGILCMVAAAEISPASARREDSEEQVTAGSPTAGHAVSNVFRGPAVTAATAATEVTGRPLADPGQPGVIPLRSALRSLVLPGVFTLGALVVLAAGQVGSVEPVSTIMADLCLVGAVARVLLLLSVVRHREVRALEEARRQAFTDELTGLPNRRAMSARCRELVERACSEHPVSLLLLDVDRFKDINDSLGHSCGDTLLIQIAERLRGVLPSNCYLARLGGDEFAALLPDRSGEEALMLGRAVRGAIAPPLVAGGIRLHLDASVGVATVVEPMESHSELLRFADIAMYRAKREHLGVVAFDGQAGSATTLEQLRTVEELRGALRGEDRSRNGNLVMHLQPQVRLFPADRRGEITGVEALVRWEHPARGLLPPGSFLPLIEMAGLRSLLAETVLDLSLGVCRDWWSQGHEIPVSVNLSAAEIEDRLLPERIQAVLRRHRLPGRALVVEMTEDLLMVDPRRARSVLDRIRRIGVGASIDDYGTGYSSLSYLQELSVDELKLDRGFIANLTTDPASATIIRTTVDLAHSLGLRLVAEGIEDADTEQLLAELGCDIGQGFHLARPMPGAQMLAWLQSRQSWTDRQPTGDPAPGSDDAVPSSRTSLPG